MVPTVKYKGYEGSIEIDMERKVCRGKILFINDLITYESSEIKDIQKVFEETVDDYLETCEQLGRSPDKSYKGSFNVRIAPDMHRLAVISAYRYGMTLNEFVEKAITDALTVEEYDMEESFDNVSAFSFNPDMYYATDSMDKEKSLTDINAGNFLNRICDSFSSIININSEDKSYQMTLNASTGV